MPLLLLAIAAFFILRQRPDLLDGLGLPSIAIGEPHPGDGRDDGTTPYAQFENPGGAPEGSAANPRLMTYTTFAVTLPAGTTREQAEAVITGRGSNIPIRSFTYDPASAVLTLTVITNDAPELARFREALAAIPGVVSAAVISSQTVRYYLLANNWVSELDAEAWIADCPRQRLLNPGVGFGECPTGIS